MRRLSLVLLALAMMAYTCEAVQPVVLRSAGIAYEALFQPTALNKMSSDVKKASKHYEWIKTPLFPNTPLTVRTCPRFSARNLISLMETLILAVPVHPALAEVAFTTPRPNIAAKLGDILFWLYVEYYSAVKVDVEKGAAGKNEALLKRKDELAARAAEITSAVSTLGPDGVMKLWRLLNTFSPSFMLLTADLQGADAVEPTSKNEAEANKKLASLRVGTKFVEYVVSAEASRDALANDKVMFKHATPADKAADKKALDTFQTMLRGCIQGVATPKKAALCKQANDVQKEFLDRIDTAYKHLETIAKEANADSKEDNKGKAQKPKEASTKVPSAQLAKLAADDLKKILGKEKPECKLKSKSPDALAEIVLASPPTADEMLLRNIKPVDGPDAPEGDEGLGPEDEQDEGAEGNIPPEAVMQALVAQAAQEGQAEQQLPEGQAQQQLPEGQALADEGQLDDQQQYAEGQGPAPGPADQLPPNAFIETMLIDQQ